MSKEPNEKDRHENEEPEDDCGILEQFPVDAKVMRVIFDVGAAAGHLARIVVMSDTQTASYAARQEYHHSNTALSLDDVVSFTMRCSALEGTEESITEFLSAMPQQFTAAQAPAWCRGVKSSNAPRKRLYKAADPDDTTRMIGVLVEQDTDGHMTQLTWYKTRDAEALFRETPETLDFQLVQTSTGAPSIDPNDIGGWTWYYTSSIGSCS